MPAPGCQPTLVYTAVHIGCHGRIRPGQHRFVIEQDPLQRANRRRIRHRIGQVDVVTVGNRQRAAQHLMDTDQQFRSIGGRQHFVDQPIDRPITHRVDELQAAFLLAQPRTQGVRSVRMIEDVPARLDLDLEFGNSQRPGAERLSHASFEIEEPQQTPPVFLHGELAAQRPASRGKR